MDQVSRPVLIALLATVVLAAGWMAFLRPSAVQTTTKDVTAPARVATQATAAAAAEQQASAATDAASNAVADPATTTRTPAAKAATPAQIVKPAAEPKAKPQAEKATADERAAAGQSKVLAEMDAGKVVVLLFWNEAGADDQAARGALKHIDLRGGKVTVHAVDVADVGRYDSVTQGVNVTQTPTTMVIAHGKATTVAGLVDPTELDQLIRQALAK